MQADFIWSTPGLLPGLLSLMPRPHPLTLPSHPTLSRGKGSGDYRLRWINTLDFGQSNEIMPCHPSVRINQWNRLFVIPACNQRSFKINTAELVQPRNCSMVTRFFSLWEGGVWAWDYRLFALFHLRLWPLAMCSRRYTKGRVSQS